MIEIVTALFLFLSLSTSFGSDFSESGLYIVEQGKNGCQIKKWSEYQERKPSESILSEDYFVERLKNSSKYLSGDNSPKASDNRKRSSSTSNSSADSTFAIKKVSFDEIKNMQVIDLEILQTMPSTFYGKTISCPVIITSIDEVKYNFQLYVTDYNGQRITKLPFMVSKFVDQRERSFILELMKIRGRKMVLSGIVNTHPDTDALEFSAREFLLIKE